MAPPQPPAGNRLSQLWQRLAEAMSLHAADADVFRRTLLGLGLSLSLLLVALFYNLLAHEATQSLQDRGKARLAAAAKKKQERDSTRAREDTIRHEMTAALRRYSGAGSAADSKASDRQPVKTDTAATGRRLPSGAAAGSTLKPARPPATEVPDASVAARHRQVGWLLRALALLGLGVLAWGGWAAWRYFWAAAQPELAPPGSGAEKDPELLQALLKTFAGQVGQVLPNPRQVKRFAAKARLQNNLLMALRIKSKAQTPPFLFGKLQQVLAFLLLLLIEQETSREDKAEATRPAGAPALARLRDLREQDFSERLPVLFSNWYRTGDREAALNRALVVVSPTLTISCQQLVEMLAAPAGQALLVQLHRLNTGLLV